MDGDGNMNLRNWGFLEPPGRTVNSHLGLQLISPIVEKPLFGGASRDLQQAPQLPVMASTNGGPFHHHRVGGLSESYVPMDYWMNANREKYFSVLSGNHTHGYYQSNYGAAPSPETSAAQSIQMPQQIPLPKNENDVSRMDVSEVQDDNGCGEAVVKKKRSGKVAKCPPKEKKQRTTTPRLPKAETNSSALIAGAAKKHSEVVIINGVSMNISELPVPVCSCTGTLHQCYRWGSGGWQSACCTTGLSVYPLPMSTKRRGARIAGRKMSIGAFKKVLEKLATEGYDFASPIDLRSYWAKHGTNKFVTIR
ncbi:protein BASIC PENTACYSTEINE2-like [Andrographis paniculata]|uniref:protein BASIC PENTACYSTEINE2-like n=1 Tax=Andrographis paniculata TaxID=175694 RepID=UPI0021E85BDB|nr:protein BASIC PENTACYSTEINE2-like [Andrographis paniculata]XP_051113621.1 protein BASIC PENTACYSTEINE2-like [Andrographis paniculata]